MDKPQHRRHSTVVAAALLCLLRIGSSATTPRDRVYVIDEECAVGTSIGHLPADAGLNDRYPPEVAGLLRFRFLSPAPPYIGLDESTGRLFVSGRVDRDVICRPDVEICRVQQDVAVQPVQYFSILKVSKSHAIAGTTAHYTIMSTERILTCEDEGTVFLCVSICISNHCICICALQSNLRKTIYSSVCF